jgi:cytochrome c2
MNKYTEIIERYLGGQMSADERIDFERKLNTEAELKEEFELQQRVMSGIKRSGIRNEVKKGYKKGSFKLKAFKIMTTIVITAATVAAVWVVKDKLSGPKDNVRYELNEENKKEWTEADHLLEAQTFVINGNADTILETQGGIIFTIPKGAFLNDKGDVPEKFELEVKEALDPLSIMRAGLSTTSDGQLLETGGMFYLNAREDGKNLTIDQSKCVHASIPDKNPGKNMQLFEGKRMADGQINWVDPKPMEKSLNTVDITGLNFYPEGFLDTAGALGFDPRNKRVTDSLYYSFICPYELKQAEPIDLHSERYIEPSYKPHSVKMAKDTLSAVRRSGKIDGEKLFKQNCAVCHTTTDQKLIGPGLRGVMNRVPKPAEAWLTAYILNNEKVLKSGDAYANRIYKDFNGAAMNVFEGQFSESDIHALINYIAYGIKTSGVDEVGNAGQSICGIEPAHIHAIWDKKFNGTILATKQFEERLQVIFKTCNSSILELYVKNMNRNMWEIDEIAATMCDGENKMAFEHFAARKDGGVMIDQPHLQKLQKYMEEKAKMYQDAAMAAYKKVIKDDEAASEKARNVGYEHQSEELHRTFKNFDEEFTANLKEAYRQLGKPFNQNPPQPMLNTTVMNTGWKNVDAYVFESTANRTTLDYTDKETGKKAVIKYEPLTLKIQDAEKYDRIVAYLIPNELSSFQRIPDVGNKVFRENLNELFEYGVLVFGFKGKTVYGGQIASAKPGEKTIQLNEMDDRALLAYKQMNRGARINMVNELEYQMFEQKEIVRKKAVEDRNEIYYRLGKVVFPCGGWDLQ